MDANIYLFVGLMATFLGFSLIIYTIVLYVAHRRNAKRFVGNIDVVSTRDWEANLQLTSPMAATPSTAVNPVSNPFDLLTATKSSTPPVAPTPVAPTPVAPTPVAPTPVAPTPVAPTMPVMTTPPQTVATPLGATLDMNHQQILVMLEQLVKQHQMGLVDDTTYQQQKLELFAQLSIQTGTSVTSSKPTAPDEPRTYTNYEELVVDFTEGIITAKEFEQHKAKFNQSAQS
jgi:hypothetical protein